MLWPCALPLFCFTEGMSQFAILRVGKLKGWGSVRAAGSHNLRRRPVPNADPDAPPPRVLHGGADLGDAVADRLRAAGVKPPRRDAVLCSEMVLTGSPERMASMSPRELDAWAADNLAWLRAEHGENLIQVVLHLDERTPHIHAAVVPVNANGGLSAKRYWGEAAGLSALQTAYAARMAPHGLERGVMRSKARHATLRAFYGALAAAGHPTPPPPMPERPRAEEGATLGLVRAGAVADAERGWRASVAAWASGLLKSEAAARLAAAGLKSENEAMRGERAQIAPDLEKAKHIVRGWRLLMRYLPDEQNALLSRARSLHRDAADRAARKPKRGAGVPPALTPPQGAALGAKPRPAEPAFDPPQGGALEAKARTRRPRF